MSNRRKPKPPDPLRAVGQIAVPKVEAKP